MRNLPEAEREEFYKKIRDAAGGAEMEEIMQEYYRAAHFEQETSKGNRRYLPLNVWKKKGFDEKRSEKVGDKKWDEELGWVYGATVKKAK